MFILLINAVDPPPRMMMSMIVHHHQLLVVRLLRLQDALQTLLTEGIDDAAID
jgi:hypothetical protein